MIKAGGILELSDFAGICDFSRFAHLPCAAHDHAIAISSDQHLMVAQYAVGSNVLLPPRISVEYPKDAVDRISTLVWLEENIIVCGFESGAIQAYDEQGNLVFQFIGPNSSVNSVKTSLEGADTVLWFLFEEGMIVGVSVLIHLRC